MKRMRKKKNRYRIAALCIAMFCIAAAWVNKDQCWKLFSQTINTKQFEAVSQSHDGFVGMKITDIDKFSPEMQNPDITKPAGAGDVPLANYKMIAALAVKRGELDRKELANFTKEHGLTGWAPTQGHIPSGVPYVGFAAEDIKEGKIKNAMIIGKGSLFLGRMTNLFDGVSFVIHGNTAAEEEAAAGVSEEEVKGLIAKAMKDFAATLMAE